MIPGKRLHRGRDSSMRDALPGQQAFRVNTRFAAFAPFGVGGRYIRSLIRSAVVRAQSVAAAEATVHDSAQTQRPKHDKAAGTEHHPTPGLGALHRR